MYSTTDETGLLNNFATEPKMYLATAPEPEQKRRYLLQGSVAIVFIATLVYTALAVS